MLLDNVGHLFYNRCFKCLNVTCKNVFISKLQKENEGGIRITGKFC